LALPPNLAVFPWDADDLFAFARDVVPATKDDRVRVGHHVLAIRARKERVVQLVKF
jgi:hypothetical protein